MATPTEALGDRLADSIHRRGRGGQRALAGQLGVSEASVAGWIKGDGVMGWLRLAEVCQALGVSADELLGLRPPPAPRLPSATADALLALVRAAVADGVIPRERLVELLRETST